MNLYTIGFTKKSAQDFFSRLRSAHISRLIDVRLNNVSQLAGFAKRDDLRFFTKELCGAGYLHLPQLAPTQDLLDEYRKKDGSWSTYAAAFLQLISDRKVEITIAKDLLHQSCLLCSEDQPDQCHRRLVAEYLDSKWGGIDIAHL